MYEDIIGAKPLSTCDSGKKNVKSWTKFAIPQIIM